MFGKSNNLADSVAALVGPGEQVLAAVAVQPKGSGNAMAVGGLAGAAIAGRGSKTTRESTAATGVEIPRWAALAVTSHRLLILKMNAMGNKAAEIVSDIALGEVGSIDVAKSMLRKQVMLNARGATFEFEAHKAAPAETLQAALAQAKGGR